MNDRAKLARTFFSTVSIEEVSLTSLCSLSLTAIHIKMILIACNWSIDQPVRVVPKSL